MCAPEKQVPMNDVPCYIVFLKKVVIEGDRYGLEESNALVSDELYMHSLG